MPIGPKRIIQAIVVIVVMVAVVQFLRMRHTPAAYAMCEKTCMAAAGCDLNFNSGKARKIGTECLVRQNTCIAQCGGQRNESFGAATYFDRSNGAGIAGGPFGAVAYDKGTGAWGMSDYSQDQDSANRSALNYCSRYGTDCSVVASYNSTCAAVALGENNALVWAKGPSLEAARKNANSACTKKTGTSCIVQHANCYFAVKEAPDQKEPSSP